MKRYLVFTGYDCYPSGGWDDFMASCASLEEARKKAIEACKKYQWSQIVDLESLDTIEEKGYGPS